MDQDQMPTPAFWTAFFSGLAAPAAVYAAPAPYAAYMTPLTPAQSFGLVGMHLQQAMTQVVDERYATVAS